MSSALHLFGFPRSGHGTLVFETGVFEGQWVAGKAHGQGIVRFKNGLLEGDQIHL